MQYAADRSEAVGRACAATFKLRHGLVAGFLFSLVLLCGSCAPNTSALVAIAQTQDRYADCAGISVEEQRSCRRPSRALEPKIAAGDPPNLDMSQTCESVVKEILRRDRNLCFTEERSAQDSLIKNWPQYSTADKTQCVGMINRGGPPSYVELISCLDTMHEASVAKEATSTATTGRARPP
jgi:hypothetical protein